MDHLMFVYGTLKRGFHNDYLLADSNLVGVGRTVQRFAMYSSGIPYVVKEEPETQIHGEVYEVDDITLENMDQLEGHPNWYKRELTEVTMEDESVLKCWLYFNNCPTGDLVENGIYELQ